MQARSASAIALLVLAACVVHPACASTKVWYGFGYRTGPGEFTKPYFTTNTDPRTDATSLIAVGAVITKSFLASINSLPLTGSEVPIPSGVFNVSQFTVPLTYNTQSPTGPNPNASATELDLGIPFPFTRIAYTNTGFPTNGNTPSFVGVYTTPMWVFSFHFDEFEDWNRYWRTGQAGNCMGLSKPTFNRTMQPVAARCFPTGRFANTGTVFPASGVTILDLGGAEWAVPPGSLLKDTAVQYGQFNGSLAYLQVMVTDEHLNNQTSMLNCRDLKFLPRNLPTAKTFPTQYCLRNVGATVVLELRRFQTIPAGNCTVSNDNPATVNSFFPSAFSPAYLAPSCLE